MGLSISTASKLELVSTDRDSLFGCEIRASTLTASTPDLPRVFLDALSL